MTDFLVRMFIKDSQNIESAQVRTSYGMLASVVGIICNAFLFAVKLVIGLMIHSITVTADSFNNLSDAASSIIGFVGVRMASRPADKEHPFGHGRAEYVSALIVALLVITVGITCFKSSFEKVLHPELIEFNAILVFILALSILVKVWLSFFNSKLGKRVKSKVMMATSADARGDVVITSATVLSILVGHFTGLAIDGYAGIVVSVFVLISGYKIAKETLEPLLGEAIDRELYESIKKKVESYEGIIGSHDLLVHTYGPTKKMATIHAEVSNHMSMDEAHDLIDTIEREVLREMDITLVIHTDPVELGDQNIQTTRSMIEEIIHSFEPDATTHDFRLTKTEEGTEVIFDLVLPYSYTKEKQAEILEQIYRKIQEEDESIKCDITVEYSYVGD